MLAKQGLSVYCLQKGTVTIAENIEWYHTMETVYCLIYSGLKVIKLDYSLACYAESLLEAPSKNS